MSTIKYPEDGCPCNHALSAAVAALKLLREDVDAAIAELVVDVKSACVSLDAFNHDIIHDLDALQTLHSNVRAAIDGASEELSYQVGQAWRRFEKAVR